MFDENIRENKKSNDASVERNVKKRREFLKASAAALAGLSFGAMLTGTVDAQTVRKTDQKMLATSKSNLKLNVAAKSVMPDGQLLGRKELLARLNLDPSTSPDAWLNITRCDSNAAALRVQDVRVLMKRGIVKDSMLSQHQLKMLRRK